MKFTRLKTFNSALTAEAGAGLLKSFPLAAAEHNPAAGGAVSAAGQAGAAVPVKPWQPARGILMTRILMNPEIIAVDQDTLGRQANRVSCTGATDI